MAISDQFYHHRKEWSYRDFKDIFGNGMSWGTKWQGVEVARVQSAKLRIALLWAPAQGFCVIFYVLLQSLRKNLPTSQKTC